MSARRLFAVAALDGDGGVPMPPETELVAFRDLGAVVAPAPYAPVPADPGELATHRSVVEHVFAARAVLPAPFGVVFRSRDSVVRWLELHYVVLADGLTLVDGRCVARVYLRRGAGVDDLSATDLTASATESFRVLRRHAVAAVPLKTEHDADVVLGASFLVTRDRWADLSEAIVEEMRRRPELRAEQTGPWPPYDFVRMEFGG